MSMNIQSFMFDLYAKAEQVVDPEESWHHGHYRDISCPVCHTILGNFRTQPLEVVVASHEKTMSSPIIGVREVSSRIVSRDLAIDLKLESAGFIVGRVQYRHHIVENYVSLVTPFELHVPTRSDQLYRAYPCRGCSRLCTLIDWQNQWISATDLRERTLCAGLGGTAIFVSDERFKTIRPSIRKELEVMRLPVREISPAT